MAASSLHPHEGYESVFDEETRAFEALDILPAEIWEIIFDNLNDPKNLIRSRRVCVSWKIILTKQKPLYNFSLVLPHLFRYLRKNDLLNCCKVASSWLIAVDDLMKFLIETGKPHQIGLGFNKPYLERFLTIFQAQPSAPVNLAIYRTVSFVCHDRIVMRYLAKFGGLVFNLGVQVDEHVLLDALRNMLYFTTNVSALRLGVCSWKSNRRADEEPSRTLERFPLPDRPHLTQLNYNSRLLLPFNWLLLKYGAQLEKLEVPCLNLDLEKLVPDKGVSLSCLKKLSMTLHFSDDIQKWTLLFKTLNVQLSQLTIKNCARFIAEIVSDIVEFIKEVQYTLDELNLDYGVGQRQCKADTLEKLNLPQLTTMSIEDVGLPTPELLQSVAPRLSKLRLTFRGKSDKDYYMKLYDEPAFWETLPSMKFVSVKWWNKGRYVDNFYTREKYNQAEKKKEEIRAVFASVCMVLLHSPIIGQWFGQK